MKLFGGRTVSAAGAVVLLFGLTACTGGGAFPEPSTTTPPAATPTPHASTDKGQIAATYEKFLNGLYSLDTTQQAEIGQLYQQYSKRTDFTGLSAAKQVTVVAAVRKIDPALATLDVSTLSTEERFLIYSELLALGAASSPTDGSAPPVVAVAESAVSIKGTAASVPLSALSVSVPGAATPTPYPTDAPIVAQQMPFKKVDGKWLIDAKGLAQQAAASPSPTPSGK